LRINGSQELAISLWSLDTEPTIKTTSQGLWKYREGDEPGYEQRCLAESSIVFNTRRILSITGRTFTDGFTASLALQSSKDGNLNGFFLPYISQLDGGRPWTIPKVARWVEDSSIVTGNSEGITSGKFNISGVAAAIARRTGRKLPLSLEDAPEVSYVTRDQIPATPFDKSKTRTKVTIDSYDRTAQKNARRITKLIATKYIGYCPVTPEQHLEFYGDLEEGLGNLVNQSIGVDLNQTILMPEGKETVYARSPEQARELLTPFYNAVSSLRRFRNAGLKSAA
jgi:hypothetical protein